MAKKNGVKVRQFIRESAAALKIIMQEHLAEIADNMVEQIRKNLERATPSQRVNAVNGVKPVGEQSYRADVLLAFSVIANEAIAMARKEVPKAKKAKLSDFDKLPKDVQKQIKQQAKFLVGTQLADLAKNLFFQFDSSFDSTDSTAQIIDDLYDSADDYIKGVAISSGSGSLAAKVINDARNAFFFDNDVLEEIAAFEFYNGDPVSEICTDLAGTIFAKDDPNAFRYTPPLHFNCKSTILPILVGDPKANQIEDLKPSSKRIEDTIQFHEHNKYCSHS